MSDYSHLSNEKLKKVIAEKEEFLRAHMSAEFGFMFMR